MNATDWTAIPKKLQKAGFNVSYCRISYSSENPLWRADAQQGERKWNAQGRDLETALTELEKQMQETNWRAMSKAA